MNETINTIEELINNVWKNDVVLSKETGKKFKDDASLESEHVIVIENKDGSYTFTRNNIENVDPVAMEHKYEMPDFADRVKCLLKQALDGKRSCNILLYGPMGTGKTEFVNEIAKEMGFAKVYHVNGVEEMGEDAFYGRLTCKIDPKTGNNYTPFEKGALYNAFIEGTEVDSNGDQILYDENGNVTNSPNGKPKVIGKPAIFFLDEFATIRPEVFLGVFNRAMEIPRNPGESRSIEITAENGKTVKSHPGMVMFFAGNTAGIGNCGKYEMSYTAQTNRMDASTLNRMSAKFKFGYNKKAEYNIIMSKLQDDLEADNLVKLRDNLRNLYREEKVETLFSTRNIVEICETASAYRNSLMNDWMTSAIKDTIFAGLPEMDVYAFNETIRSIYNVDLVNDDKEKQSNMDYI